MDLDEASAMVGIRIVCAHCGAAEIDDLEVLTANELHTVDCDACKRRFHLLIAECESCGEETVLTWPAVPTPDEIGLATCVHCGNRLHDHADDIRTMVRGR